MCDVAAQIDVAMVYATTGRYSEAADLLQKINLDPVFPTAARLLRTAPLKSTSPQSVPHLGGLAFVYLYIGAPNRALDYYEELAEAGFFAGGRTDAFLWHPSYATVRKTDRFKTWVRASGLVEYWRAKGWPEFCHPTTADDFVCD